VVDGRIVAIDAIADPDRYGGSPPPRSTADEQWGTPGRTSARAAGRDRRLVRTWRCRAERVWSAILIQPWYTVQLK
jgi:hypothetical protein